MFAVYKRELQAYFYSPIAYVFMGFFLLVTGLFFAGTNVMSQQASYSTMLGNMSFLFMLLVPVLTMRLLSEERKNKTDQLLLTAPVSVTGIVLGKYFAAISVFAITLVVSFIYPLVLFTFGNPSFAEILTGYIGFFLLGASLISVGLLISSLTENQVVSALATFGVLLVMYLGGVDLLIQLINVSWIGTALDWFSVYNRYNTFGQGLLGIAPIIYYISFCAVFLFLTVRSIERRRWSEV